MRHFSGLWIFLACLLEDNGLKSDVTINGKVTSYFYIYVDGIKHVKTFIYLECRVSLVIGNTGTCIHEKNSLLLLKPEKSDNVRSNPYDAESWGHVSNTFTCQSE